MSSTIAIIRHNGHTAEADHVADGPNGERMFACFGCEADVIDPEIVVQCADCDGR